jgi:hypothetical protein
MTIYRVIILSDEYGLSLSAIILLPSWAFGRVGFVKMMSELRGSDGIFVRTNNIDIFVSLCIDIRFRFVAVWSEAESQDCVYEKMIKCLGYLEVLEDEDESFFLGIEEQERWCR